MELAFLGIEIIFVFSCLFSIITDKDNIGCDDIHTQRWKCRRQKGRLEAEVILMVHSFVLMHFVYFLL